MNDLVALASGLLQEELQKPEVKTQVLDPMLRWLLWNVAPYVVAFVLLNFFMTIAAVALVLYFLRPRMA